MLHITFFSRKSNPKFVSIEKLFNTIKMALEKKGATVTVVEAPNEGGLFGMIKTLFFFKKKQNQINHVTGAIHWSVLLLNRGKTVLTIHDFGNFQEYRGVKKWLYFYIWLYFPLRKLKYITVISEKTKREIVGYLPWAESKISVIPNCLTIPFDENIEKNKNEKPILLCVGYYEKKNIDRVFEAAVGTSVKIYHVGFLSEERIEFLNHHNIEYTNFHQIDEETLIKCYSEADILCFPSLYEGFGLPILEGQAKKCAVITSNISPMKEVAGSGAVLVDPFSVEEIREAILKVVQEEDFKQELIKKGIQNVKNYLPEKIADLYLELYKKIADEA